MNSQRPYPDYEEVEYEFGAFADESLNPRGPEMLKEYVTRLDLPAGSKALDVGCADGTFALMLHEDFGFDVVGIDPSGPSIVAARQAASDRGVEIDFDIGILQALPSQSASIDLVWCRDTIELIDDLEAAFNQVRRVLKPSGYALIYTMCIAEEFTAVERDRVLKNLGAFPRSMSPQSIEQAIGMANLKIVESIDLGPEWGEYAEERSGKSSQRLLRGARLLRQPERYIQRYGQTNYDTALADYLWHVYRMIGKLSSRIYVVSVVASTPEPVAGVLESEPTSYT